MTRVYLLVEGQTEETFVRDLLVPHYSRLGLYFTPIIVNTSPGFKGGVVSYGKVKPQIERQCKQDHRAYVSTLFDLYALPTGFPGKEDDEYSRLSSGHEKARHLEAKLMADIAQRNFIPNLMVHEFEALLFTKPECFDEWADTPHVVDALIAIRESHLPEEIDDGLDTAPSKRILKAMPAYQKTVHGPLIACEIGLDAIRTSCPHFDGWLKKLERCWTEEKTGYLECMQSDCAVKPEPVSSFVYISILNQLSLIRNHRFNISIDCLYKLFCQRINVIKVFNGIFRFFFI